ncbi:MAG: O-antigen ligase family protein [Gemmatimonadetes bacterium]|nr:O-antigen ligase family protein [Gemmatimonadota bacterium]
MGESVEKGWSGLRRVWTEVDWSLSFVAFLIYFVIVITYRFPGASYAVAAAAAGLIVEKGQRRMPYWLGWLLAFLIWGAVAYTQSQFPQVAWSRGVVDYGKLWLIMLVAVNVLTNPARVRFFLVFFLLLYATHPIRGALFNTFVYGYSLQNRVLWNGTWANPNDMAAVTFLALGIATGLLKDRSDLIRKAALVAVIVMTMVILMTRSRGAFLALAIFAMLTVLTNRKKIKALVGMGVLLGFAILAAPEGTFDRFINFTRAVRVGDTSEAHDLNSMQQRMEIWRIAGRIIADQPVFGVGLGAYNLMHYRYARNSAQTEIGGGARDTHSTFLRVTAETGYIGAALFFIPFVLAIARGRRIRKRYGRAFPDIASNVNYIEAGLVGYLACGVFGSYAHTVFLWLGLGLLAILTEDLKHTAQQAFRPVVRRPLPTQRARLPQPVGAPR